MTGWQWHQLDHMQIICTLAQTDSHAYSTSPLSFFTGLMPFLLPNRQGTEGIKEHKTKLDSTCIPPWHSVVISEQHVHL